MGAACFVVLERAIDGIDPSDTNGRWLAQFSDELDAAAEELGMMPLSQLFSTLAPGSSSGRCLRLRYASSSISLHSIVQA